MKRTLKVTAGLAAIAVLASVIVVGCVEVNLRRTTARVGERIQKERVEYRRWHKMRRINAHKQAAINARVRAWHEAQAQLDPGGEL